ncbi:winged helix-turn-helix transcriptional regulator [Planktothrix agardhii]|uniref:winged helix-turn-helix transcriptional regulator n=1 Tax=Planktothrix agardhii TaxID=1160 RepID=UPI002E2FA7CC|nr:winged helix-turn-helix transcriptional regulator [Planktothrix agardhii]
MKNFRLDLIREAIKLLLDNPHLSNREVARQIGTSEPSIRYWKKHPIWEQERQKLINDHAEAMGLNDRQQRAEYKENLEKQRQHLEILMEQIYANSMRAINLSNKVYANCLLMDDPFKACSMAIKAGAHIQAKVAMQGVTAYIAIMNHLYQFHVLIEYFENLEDGE